MKFSLQNLISAMSQKFFTELTYPITNHTNFKTIQISKPYKFQNHTNAIKKFKIKFTVTIIKRKEVF